MKKFAKGSYKNFSIVDCEYYLINICEFKEMQFIQKYYIIYGQNFLSF